MPEDQAQVKLKLGAMPIQELIKLYNALTGKTIKKFARRADGERLTLQALILKQKIVGDKPVTVRNVTNMAQKLGRPTKGFAVALGEEAKISLRSNSLRKQMIDYIKEQATPSVSIDQLIAKFGDRAKGAVQKLMAVDWLKRV